MKRHLAKITFSIIIGLVVTSGSLLAQNTCGTADVAVLGSNSVTAAPYYHTYTSPNNAYLTISTAGTGVDTDLNVYDICGGNLLAENDDINAGSGIYQSQLTMQVGMGQSIIIEWLATWEATGFNFQLTEDIIDPYEPVSVADSTALVALYTTTNGPVWNNQNGWLTTYVSDWFGVTVSGGRVTELNIPHNNLAGPLPAAIGDLDGLTFLDLSSNKFYNTGTGTGYTIPSETGQLTNLVHLNLDRCGLTGSVPTSLGNLTQLEYLRLGFDLSGQGVDQVIANTLDANYPSELGNLTNLTNLALGGNSTTTGPFPAFIASLINLEELYLVGSQFAGAIANEIGDLPNLHTLSLNNSGFTSLPATIQNATALEILYANDAPSLVLPAELASLALAQLTLDGTTPLSIDLSTLPSLTLLNINNKGLTTLPSLPTSLTSLAANLNKLTSVEISGLTSLVILALTDNDLTDIPDLTGISLNQLYLSNNRLDFLDLEPGTPPGISLFIVDPQRLGTVQNLQFETGDPMNLNFAVPGTANTYQWKQNTVNVGTDADTYSVGSATATDEGVYALEVTNSLVPGVTIISEPINVSVVPVYPLPGTLFDIVDAGDLSRDGKDVNGNDPVTIQYYGGTWGDFNNDGYDDLYLGGISTGIRNFIYKNNGNGTFSRIPYGAYEFKIHRSGVWGDYNNDGFSDLFAPDFGAFAPDSTDGFATLFTNNGDETFSATSVGDAETLEIAGAWADLDQDGDLDLLAPSNGQSLFFFRNDGGVLTPVNGQFSTTSTWSITTVDIDNDGDLDVFLPANTTEAKERSLYRNNGNNSFSLLSGNTLMTDQSIFNARGGSWADIDNDGDYDFYAMDSQTNSTDGNLFFINDGNGNFTRQVSTIILGEKVAGGRGSVFADFNNDGHVDLFTSQSVAPAGWYLYMNDGDGTFTKETTQVFKNGGPFPGASVTDFDNDGFLDIFTSFFGADYNALYRNKGNANNWIQLKLRGTLSNRDAIGAKVSLKAGGFWRHHQVITTNGFASQNSLVAHFGLAGATTADSIKISWPNGFQQVKTNIAGNQKILLIEPDQLQQDRQADSLALVALYNATNGSGWTNSTNWLAGTLDTWHGVTVSGDRVTGLNLLNNNLDGLLPTEIGNLSGLQDLVLTDNLLAGSIPVEIGNLANLQSLHLTNNLLSGSIPATLPLFNLLVLNLSGNQLSGVLPVGVTTPILQVLNLSNNNLTGALGSNLPTTLTTINISNNQFSTVPDLTPLVLLTTLNISNNHLTYEDIEPNIGITGFVYAPQKPIPSQPDQQLAIGQPLSISYTVGGTANAYQWFLEGDPIGGANTNSYTKPAIMATDIGHYYLQITNATAPLLTLRSDSTVVSLLSGVLASDSLAVVALYDSTNGVGWTNRTNWLTGNIDTWFGVTVTDFKITAITLPANNLTGAVPSTLATLLDLETLNLTGNQLTGLPNLAALTNLTALQVENNRLDFGDLEANASITGITYAPQDSVDASQDLRIDWNTPLTLTSSVEGTANLYQWKKDNINISGATNTSLNFPAIAVADEGVYNLTVTNSLVPGLSLSSRLKEVTVSTIDRDSVALISLYDATTGTSWINNTGWGAAPLATWAGVTVNNFKVTALNLPNNGLQGTVPADFTNLQELTTLDLSGNRIQGIPVLTSLTQLASVRVENNRLDFADLESNVSVTGITYIPQDTVSNYVSVLKQVSTSETFTSDIGATANIYQWRKNGTDIAGATTSDLTISNITFADDAVYTFQATSPLVPGLTLSSAQKVLRVSSLERDELALTKFFNDTDGPNWVRNDNWVVTPLATGNWFGVTVANNRVISVVLPANEIKGALTASIADVETLEVIDLSGNEIEQLPNLASLPNITSLNVSGNKLDFASLIANSVITGIDYQNQADLGTPTSDSVAYHTDFKVKILTKGDGNQYQWKRNGQPIAGAIDSTYLIASINRSNMGDYVVEITNPAVPNLTLRSSNKQVLATATLEGQVLENPEEPVAQGKVTLFKINPTGGYDTTRIQAVNQDGKFRLEKIVLDDYLLLAEADTLVYATDLPTYYKNTLYWEEADSLFINEDRDSLTILVQKEPSEAPKGQGEIKGVFEDPSIQVPGRTKANKRIANAGGSVRRRTNVGKPQEEVLTLVAYLFTNENGEFNFSNLEEGEYLLNLQYPGVPMDPTSFINISIGVGLSRKAQVEALIVEGKIKVNKLVVTGWGEEEKRFRVYPNPASTDLTIEVVDEMSDLSYVVSNAMGTPVRQGDLPFTGIQLIATSELSVGIYVVQIKQRDAIVKTFRVVLTH